MTPAHIRIGEASDIPSIMALVKELALYEKAPHEVTNTTERMLQDGFGEQPYFTFWVVEVDQRIVGMALCYVRYSTWKGPMLYLEDFYIQEPYRGAQLGKQLFEVCMESAKTKGMSGICWQVLDWNEPAIRFYKKFEAELDSEWINGKIMF